MGIELICVVLYMQQFGFGLIKFLLSLLSKTSLVFFLITGTVNVIFLNPNLFTFFLVGEF